MKILVFTQFFSPEIGATQTRLHSFAAGLAQRGHDVTVFCEVPNHPQGLVHPDYRGRAVVRSRVDGFRTLHLWVRTTPVKTTRSRIEFYGSYAAMAILAGSVQKRPDVVFASSPPLPVAAAAAAVATRHRVPWVFDVRDLWPEAAVAMGELSEGRVLDLIQRLADRLYADAAAVTAVTEPFRKAIARKVSRPEKVVHLPNGTTSFWLDGADLEVDRRELDLPCDRFVWTFAGNVGSAQGLDAAVDAAELLADDGFRLLILGDGPAKAGLEERVARLPAGAVEFRPQVTPQLALRHLRCSDALLVPLALDPTLADFVPSKLYDFCAVGRPVILAAAGESSRLVSGDGAALCVPPGNPARLAEQLRLVRGDAGLRQRLVDGGRKFATRNLRDRQVDQLSLILERAVDQRLSGSRP